jgi:hypothetical protein
VKKEALPPVDAMEVVFRCVCVCARREGEVEGRREGGREGMMMVR